MGILDGIVDWLATQVMNLLDLASTSVLGALGCNMDTFKRYFPAASAMYEIFIWTAIGLDVEAEREGEESDREIERQRMAKIGRASCRERVSSTV